ncbi:MAG: GNAT family N-acetyltransferase [Rhodocyclaceae bacterium]|nr:GNAT family N-acetyltransferase [Rhodocyclaceae bacterium]
MLHTELLTAAGAVSAADWQRLATDGDPFVSRAFLGAAEQCVTARGPAGWQPMHLALRTGDGRLTGLLPLYQRHHWYGDFAMDYAWGPAWQQAGLNYFPKLVSGVPFTPSPGPRLLVTDNDNAARAALIAAAIDLTAETGASNWQCLFVREPDRAAFETAGLLLRRGVQFHWLNRGYRDFADFLATFTSEKRKKLKRERRAVTDAGLRIEARHGDEIDDALWLAIHRHYRSTFERLGGVAAFTADFFRSVGDALGRRMVVLCAFAGDQPVASAICYRDIEDRALYGRHWGTDIDCPGLHFELCYHAGIEYAISHGLQRFEPGAQGEHKIARGFEPVSTWSAYWVADPRLRDAVARYLAREDGAMLDYQDEMAGHLPYRTAEQGPA